METPMKPSQLPESITFVLGPPARPEERANFDRYEAELARPAAERDEKFCAFYESLMQGYLSELVKGNGGDDLPSPIEEIFEIVLGVPIRIRSHSVGFGLLRGQHNHNLQFPWNDVLTPSGPLPALSGDVVQDLAAAIGYALKLDWVCAQRFWPDPASRPRARRARTAAGAR
jgi:hypothetical protein